MEVNDWLAGVPLPGGQAPFDAVEVRFKSIRKGFYRNPNGLALMAGDVVTVEAANGYDVGTVSLAGELVRAQMLRKNGNTDTFELRKVLRKSSQEEIDKWHASRERENETMLGARRICKEAGLDMKVSDVEYQGDGSRATVFYTADERIDFREAVRKVSNEFKVRVDMKQIGARQEAARLGGIGPCGRELCCSTWLTDLRSVTTSAARYQQLALNPQKLAGLCGKLKCCLNYELDMYMEAIKSYPSPNAKLKTRQGTGVHMKTDIFKERMWYMFKKPGEPMAMASFPVDTVRDILAQNKLGVEPEVDLHMAEEQATTAVDEPATDYENVIDGTDELSRFDKMMKGGGKRRRRDNRKKKPGEQRAAAEGGTHQGKRNNGPKQAAPQGPPPNGAPGEKRSRDARGRRRKGPRRDGAAPAGNAPKPSDA
ncbi:MAG TPA: regulatory iron-sulfur-containing complex subunit RicT [Flavobacteriales bacterium]|nr:regulatory iron-sulfur-containing complex subunit RicT [Flavobacteriales bacterium]